MATSYTSNYAGKVAGDIMRPALVSGDTLANNYVNIHEQIKDALNIPIMSMDSDMIQAYACDYSAAGTSATTERILTPTRLMVNHTICKNTFLSTWYADATGNALVDKVIPNDWYRVFEGYLGDIIGRDLEYNLWQGNLDTGVYTSTYTRFNGLITVLDGLAGTIKENATAAYTAANIIAQLRLAKNAMTAAMIGDDTFEIFISRKSGQLYREACANDFNNLLYTSGETPLLDGYKVNIAPGVPDDFCVIARRQDLHVGMNLVSDTTNIKLVDTTETLADDNVRLRAEWSAGTQVTNESQIVISSQNIES